MVIVKKTELRIAALVLFSFIILFFTIYETRFKTIEILFFANPKCIISNRVNRTLVELKDELKEKINIEEIVVHIYSSDPEDSEEIRRLRDEYEVYGVPVVIINGKEFAQEFTKTNLKREICNNYLIKPGVCK